MKSIVCVAVAMVVLGGCRLESKPLWIAMSVDKTVVAMDDSVRVSLAVTNPSDRDVMVHPESAYGRCLTGFEVLDAQRRAVRMSAVCTAALPPEVPLAPGESQSITTWWHPDISRVAPNDTPISPGVYTIRGAVVGDGRVVRSGVFEIAVGQ